MPFNISFENPQVIQQFAAMPEVLKRETTKWLVDMAMWIKDDLKRRVPVKTGQLRSSIRYQLEGNDATFHSVHYGKTLDEGTKPFTISPKGAKALAFNRGSEKVFATSIKHPGIKARNFTIQSLEAAESEADRQADVIAERIFRAVIS